MFNVLRTADGKSRLRQWALRVLRATVSQRRLFISDRPVCRRVYLTFDDGPHPQRTPRILDVLRQFGVRATFFVIGQHAAEHPELVRRIAAEGHTLGSHTFWHKPPHEVNGQSLLGEVRQSEALLEGITGGRCRLFRPPYGKLTLGKCRRLWAEQRTIVLWNQDPKDFAATSAEQLTHWFATHRLAGGDVILLHDTAPFTADVLPEVIERARQAGLDFAPLGADLGKAEARTTHNAGIPPREI